MAMLNYTIHAPARVASGPPETAEERADALVFVKDGFSWPAFLLGPFWLAYHRMWRELIGYVVVFLLVDAILWLVPGGMAAAGPVLLLAALAFGFEADALRQRALERKGFEMIGTAAGRSFEECEQRFLTSWLGTGQTAAPRTA